MALIDVPETFRKLKNHPTDVKISAMEAAAIWKLFMGVSMPEEKFHLNFEYRAYMQAAFMCLVDGSAAIGYARALFEATVNPNGMIARIIVKLSVEALEQYYRNKIGAAPKLYECVLVSILYENRPCFDLIDNDLSLQDC